MYSHKIAFISFILGTLSSFGAAATMQNLPGQLQESTGQIELPPSNQIPGVVPSNAQWFSVKEAAERIQNGLLTKPAAGLSPAHVGIISAAQYPGPIAVGIDAAVGADMGPETAYIARLATRAATATNDPVLLYAQLDRKDGPWSYAMLAISESAPKRFNPSGEGSLQCRMIQILSVKGKVPADEFVTYLENPDAKSLAATFADRNSAQPTTFFQLSHICRRDESKPVWSLIRFAGKPPAVWGYMGDLVMPEADNLLALKPLIAKLGGKIFLATDKMVQQASGYYPTDQTDSPELDAAQSGRLKHPNSSTPLWQLEIP